MSNIINNKNLIITIDGPSGSGKTSCGKFLAEKNGYQLLDSGKVYKLFCFFLKQKNINWNNLNLEIKKNIKIFNPSFKNSFFYLKNKKIENENLENLEIENLTTKIINFKNVRNKINNFCQKITKEKNFILLGRDAGTNILPEANFKFFLDSSHEIRKKRKEEFYKKNKLNLNNNINIDQELKKRKEMEEENNILNKSWDSFYIKNEHTTIEETTNKMVKIINQYSSQLNKVLIIGEINVGKSSLFNLLTQKKEAIESKIKNTTKDFFEKQATIEEKNYILIDSGGMENEENNFILKEIWKRNFVFINKTEVLLWVVNFKTGITKNTKLISKQLKKHKKKVILIINKTEKEITEEKIKYWKKIGIKNFIFISVKKKINILDLKKMIWKKIEDKKEYTKTKKKKEINILILGQTNNGKSSLFNSLLKTEKALTSHTKHTTTNIINGFIVYNKIKLNFFDTAGIRRRRQKKTTLEKKTYDKILEKTKDFDIAIVVLDITKDFVSQDIRIIGLIKKLKKRIILVGNKIDKLSDGKRKIEIGMKKYFRLLKKKEIVLTSAKTGEGCKKLLNILTKEK